MALPHTCSTSCRLHTLQCSGDSHSCGMTLNLRDAAYFSLPGQQPLLTMLFVAQVAYKARAAVPAVRTPQDLHSTSFASWWALLQDRSQAGGPYFNRLSPTPEGGQELDLNRAALNGETAHMAPIPASLTEQSSCASGSPSSVPGSMQVWAKLASDAVGWVTGAASGSHLNAAGVCQASEQCSVVGGGCCQLVSSECFGVCQASEGCSATGGGHSQGSRWGAGLHWVHLASCCLQAQLQVYRELQWTASAAPSIFEFEHGHYMGYAIMEDGLQEANQSEEPWNLKVGPDCTPHQPSCSGALCAPGCASPPDCPPWPCTRSRPSAELLGGAD